MLPVSLERFKTGYQLTYSTHLGSLDLMKIESLILSLVAVATALLVGCASTKMMSTDADAIKGVGEWTLGFTYETGSVTRNLSDGEIKSIAVKQTGRNPKSLELLEDVRFLLQGKGVQIVAHSTASSGKILLNPIPFTQWYSGFQSCSVTFESPAGHSVARLKVKNGDRNASYKSEEAFAKYIARSIREALGR